MTTENRILQELASVSLELAQALENAGQETGLPWLEQESVHVEKDEDGWMLYHLIAGSPGRAFMDAADTAGKSLDRDSMEAAGGNISEMICAPAFELLSRAEEEFRLEKHPCPEQPTENPWEYLKMPLSQQTAIDLQEVRESLGDDLAYRSESSLAHHLERLRNLHRDILHMQNVGGDTSMDNFGLEMEKTLPVLALEMERIARDPTGNTKPSWSGETGGEREGRIELILQTFRATTRRGSETHRVRTAASLAEIMLGDMEETVEALYMSHGERQEGRFPGRTVPEDEAHRRLMELTAGHLVSWRQQVNIDLEEAILDSDSRRMMEALQRAVQIREDALAAMVHGRIPEFRYLKDTEDRSITHAEMAEVRELTERRKRTLMAEMEKTSEDRPEVSLGRRIQQYTWDLTGADKAIVRNEYRRPAGIQDSA